MMKLYHGLHPADEPTVVALGCFDGLHTGHRRVISSAFAPGLAPAVFTFQTDILQEGKNARALLSQSEKMRLLQEMGVRYCWMIPFAEIRAMSAEEFVQRVLKEVCRAQRVCCGFNFHFGSGGRATADDLTRLCAARGIETAVQPPVEERREPVSSTRIRRLVEEGCMKEACALLGRPFVLDFPVLHGRQLGRTLGVPTINQPIPPNFVLPRFGVYASIVDVGGDRYYGVTNVGVKPTVGADAPLAETWMPDYRGEELYGETVRTELHGFIRPERKFSGIRELQEHIFQDRETAKKMIYKL